MITSEDVFQTSEVASTCRGASLYAGMGQRMQLNPISILENIYEPCLILLTAQLQKHTPPPTIIKFTHFPHFKLIVMIQST